MGKYVNYVFRVFREFIFGSVIPINVCKLPLLLTRGINWHHSHIHSPPRLLYYFWWTDENNQLCVRGFTDMSTHCGIILLRVYGMRSRLATHSSNKGNHSKELHGLILECGWKSPTCFYLYYQL